MDRPRLLWVCVTHGCESNVSRALAEEYFDVQVCPDVAAACGYADRFASQVVCWDYEEADAMALRAMRDFKIANPSLPILMLTAQHSEALAVWAFRAQVWNYLTKPVAIRDLRANFGTLAALACDAPGAARAVRQVRALLPGEFVAQATAADHPAPLQAAVAHVERHYAEKLRQATVAASCDMSTSTFSRAFKAEYGVTFSSYVMRFRIAQACYLLRLGQHSATAVGLAVGFDDASHFARAFRKLMGVSPSAYRREGSATKRANGRRPALLGGAPPVSREPRALVKPVPPLESRQAEQYAESMPLLQR